MGILVDTSGDRLVPDVSPVLVTPKPGHFVSSGFYPWDDAGLRRPAKGISKCNARGRLTSKRAGIRSSQQRISNGSGKGRLILAPGKIPVLGICMATYLRWLDRNPDATGHNHCSQTAARPKLEQRWDAFFGHFPAHLFNGERGD